MSDGDSGRLGWRADGDGLPVGVAREGLVAAHEAEANRLLRGLPIATYDRLLAELRPARLDFKQVLSEPGVPIPHVHFVRDGAVSVIAVAQKGGSIEVGTIGNEGFVGLPLLLGDDRMTQRVTVQVEGDAWRMQADAFRRVLEELPVLRRRCELYAQYFFEQVSQSVACNRLHTLEERCARWLLMTDDRVASDGFELTHEFIATMLGVRRAGVTVAMGLLQRQGIVQSYRGRITVMDRARLEAASCDCYGLVKQTEARLLS
jgi:CRP-like cAMP-binding protein